MYSPSGIDEFTEENVVCSRKEHRCDNKTNGSGTPLAGVRNSSKTRLTG